MNIQEQIKQQGNISVGKGQNYLLVGDNSVWLKKIPDNSIDSIVTDPPAGISFMARGWDSDKGGRDHWIKWMQEVATECKRVLKPGGHAFVWAIPRTSHWTATAWENAGFEIRDVVAHIFGSGFPKSHNVEKAVQKIQPERSDEFKGIGTALKPAREDWILMRKPLAEKNVALNVLKYGTGGINIDESRVGTEKMGGGTMPDLRDVGAMSKEAIGIDKQSFGQNPRPAKRKEQPTYSGRFPANLIHDNSEEVRECFPDAKGMATQNSSTNLNVYTGNALYHSKTKFPSVRQGFNDSGNASRFFKSIVYIPKASKSERNKGCEGLEDKFRAGLAGADRDTDEPLDDVSERFRTQPAKNNHPTVKPIALMEYLIKMVTPKGGIVLDPFAGSGSTLVAAKQNGFGFVGIEREEEYVVIGKARLEQAQKERDEELKQVALLS